MGRASSVSTDLSAYMELPGHHLRSALDLVASAPTTEYLDSAEDKVSVDGANATCRHDQEGANPFLAAYYYYYFEVPDLGSGDDCYDPTRESFHIEAAGMDDDKDDDDAHTPPPPTHVERPKEPTVALLPAGHQGGRAQGCLAAAPAAGVGGAVGPLRLKSTQWESVHGRVGHSCTRSGGVDACGGASPAVQLLPAAARLPQGPVRTLASRYGLCPGT